MDGARRRLVATCMQARVPMVHRIPGLLAAASVLFPIPFLHAQEAPQRLAFEVASVKVSQPGGRGGGIKAQPGGQRYSAQNAPVKLMISLMYKVPLRQIEGGPDWINNQGFDIEAK